MTPADDTPDTGDAQTGVQLLRALLEGYAAVAGDPAVIDDARRLLDALDPVGAA